MRYEITQPAPEGSRIVLTTDDLGEAYECVDSTPSSELYDRETHEWLPLVPAERLPVSSPSDTEEKPI
jgi:hypothetical protein